MPGIILSLLVTLLALSFAFYTDDSSARGRKNWRDSSWHTSKRPPETGGHPLVKPDDPDMTEDAGSPRV